MIFMDYLKQIAGLEEHLAVGGTTRSRKTLSCHMVWVPSDLLVSCRNALNLYNLENCLKTTFLRGGP